MQNKKFWNIKSITFKNRYSKYHISFMQTTENIRWRGSQAMPQYTWFCVLETMILGLILYISIVDQWKSNNIQRPVENYLNQPATQWSSFPNKSSMHNLLKNTRNLVQNMGYLSSYLQHLTTITRILDQWQAFQKHWWEI